MVSVKISTEDGKTRHQKQPRKGEISKNYDAADYHQITTT
jgi:hypothetical protein